MVIKPCRTADLVRSFGPTYWIHLQDDNYVRVDILASSSCWSTYHSQFQVSSSQPQIEFSSSNKLFPRRSPPLSYSWPVAPIREIITCSRALPENLTLLRLVRKRPFTEAQGSLSCSQGPFASPTSSEINPVHVPQHSLFISDPY